MSSLTTLFKRSFHRCSFHPYNRLKASLKIRSFTTSVSSPDSLILNEPCIQQMKKVCVDGSKLRITVESGGCSGFQYNFELIGPESELADDDICVTHKKMSVVIDDDSMDLVRGSTVDYHSELIRAAFRIIDNPNAELGCSCGSSFALKN